MPGAEGLLVLSLGVRFEDAADGSNFGRLGGNDGRE
jgi:hypothetical protein